MATIPEIDIDVNFNTYVGAETGVMKGVCFGSETPLLKNFMSFEGTEKPQPIIDISWADDSQKELLVAFKNSTVKVYNTKLRAFTQELSLNYEEGSVVSLRKHESNYLVGLENGTVSMWSFMDAHSVLNIQTGENLSKFKQCPSDPSIIATGGKENDVKIWNLKSERPDQPIFKAKNVPHVYELRTPVWVQDLTFLPQTTELVAIGSRHGFVRLYDTKVDNKNRPVIDMPFCDHAVMSISSTMNDRQVLVGSAKGEVGLIDLRNYGKERLVHKFHGFKGSIRSIVADENTPFFVACGLDRHLYLCNLNERKPIKCMYLRSRLNCLAITKNFLMEGPVEDVKVKSVWHNIDMDVLPTATPIKTESSPIKRRKVQKAE